VTSDALELVGLMRRFGEVVALDDVSFHVAAGEMVGFVGPNGAGKTTAMRIALGVLQADAGRVRWRDRDVDAETRRRFGYLPEERGASTRRCACSISSSTWRASTASNARTRARRPIG
jgi:ABC-2 type transport system ATP-binding protein